VLKGTTSHGMCGLVRLCSLGRLATLLPTSMICRHSCRRSKPSRRGEVATGPDGVAVAQWSSSRGEFLISVRSHSGISTRPRSSSSES